MTSSKKKDQRVTPAASSLTIESSAPTLTVGRIVEQLSSVAPDTAAMSERIRHWTREGLLFPIHQSHSGTGRHRGYSPDASYEAAILNALATAGLQVVSRPYIVAALSKGKAALRKWQRARRTGRNLPLFLVICHDMTENDGEPTASIREGNLNFYTTAEITILINLSQLFSHVLEPSMRR
jgi:hypothetical protein